MQKTNEVAGEATRNLFTGHVPIKTALHELRLRLLDLTGRNRLINFKHSPGKSLQFVHTSIDGAMQRLRRDQSNSVLITPLQEPDRTEWIERNGRLGRPDPKDFATQIGLNPSYDLNLRSDRAVTTASSGRSAHTLFYAEDLGKHCRKLEREARSAIEETGSNMLYLVAGFLEFPESANSDKLYLAPLICLPVSISKKDEGQYSSFFLSYTGEELADNLSLREKIKRDFGLNLPEYDAESDGSIDAYLDMVADTVSRRPKWRVRRMMTLTLLSFSNMLLVRDLDPENWPCTDHGSSLLDHPLVKQVFEGSASDTEPSIADEYPIDEHPRGDLPLIYDADSSQHSALIDVLEGKSRVIEGPPGTGKSQTITNLIAAALQAGKSVLFVAEKLAALEVVKARLSLAGLAPFVLELHSNKANKKQVLEDLNTRLKLRTPNVQHLPQLLEQQEHKRRELKAYADLMNAKSDNQLDLTLHQVMWRAELNRQRCGSCFTEVQHLDYLAATRTTPSQRDGLGDRLRYLAAQLEPIGAYDVSHPLWGFFPAEFKPEDDLPVQRTLSKFALKFAFFSEAIFKAEEMLGGSDLHCSAQSSDRLLSILESIPPADTEEVAFGLLPRFFTATDPTGLQGKATLDRLSTRAAAVNAAETALARALLHRTPANEPQTAAAQSALLGLKTRGLDALNATSLASTRAQLQQLTADAAAALKELHATASTLGLPFNGSQAAIQQITTIWNVAAAAPRSHLHLLHPALGDPGVITTLQEGIEELTQNQHRFEELNTHFYMDDLPSEEVLSSAIRTLREGDAWYRFIQTPWRQAVRIHHQLQRKKEKQPAAERLQALEKIQQLRKAQAAWRSNERLRQAAGSHYQDENTPLENLLEAAQWLQSTNEALELVQVPASFNAFSLDRPALMNLQSKSHAIQAALTSLKTFEEICKKLFAAATPSQAQRFFDQDWKSRLVAVQETINAVTAAESAMLDHVRPGTTAHEGLTAITLSGEFPRMVEQLSADTEGKSLFGNAYAGHQTHFNSAFAAHAYGTLIKNAGLPASIEQVLLSADCPTNHGLLSAHMAAISIGWKAVSDFAEAMAAFGRFELSAWVAPAGRSTSGYAQALAEKTQTASEKISGLLAWTQYVGARHQAVNAGLESFVTCLESNAVAPSSIVHAFLYRFYATIAQSAFNNSATLRQFSGLRHTSVQKEFIKLDREIIQLRGQQIAADCKRQGRTVAGTSGSRVGDKSEMELLNYLIPQQRPRVPVRRMLECAGQSIQALKPCFMMGPQAVAQFLAPGQLHFDIVVMDEASQLRPEQAIGAIARGTQLVVVGDPKQLPPTSFFSRMGNVDNDNSEGMGPAVTTEAESILDVCLSHFQPVRRLRWHYRSRHESLIAFSNQRFYRGDLIVFPAPYPKSKSLGLRYQYISDGVYENQMNPVEARRLVDAAIEHILHRSEDSLGIVTLNIKQRDLIAEMLEERLRTLPEAIAFKERWESEGMGLFVKNLESVQGDERDCIFISTTFGKAKGTDVVRQTFGPITRAGGWRRLNVLFTRAKKAVAVFSSMRPEDIIADSNTSEGTKALRDYLEYARNGSLPMERETGLPPDSDFEVAVADMLRGTGYEVEPQLGVAGFRIDIAVRHPAHKSGYLAAIECDGASYHSGVSVRDRDRIRQEILESLGWQGRIWRIWSTDWFRNPQAESERLLQFLEMLKQQPLAEEFIVEESLPEAARPPAEDVIHAEDDPERLIVSTEADELEANVGDLVAYAPLDAQEQTLHVLLTARQTDPEQGLVAASTPLGIMLMGATIGETVVLRVPGRAAQSFVIQGIKRSTEMH